MKYAIVTFGCRVNQADSLRIESDLRARGGQESSSADADIVVVNTCSVTATADQGARQTIRRIARDNPSARIVVTGCYATRRPDEIAALPNVAHVVSNAKKDSLVPDLLTTASRFGDGDGPCGLDIAPGVAGRTAFTLRVQTGCEERCAYCIIPTTRGAGRSLPPAAVVAEVERIAAAGFREVALTGVHLGSYGRDLTPPCSFADLLRAIDAVRADVVYRVSSLEPMDCTPEIVEIVVRSAGRFAPHFHLPLQHASDRMLDRMRRPYALAYYRQVVDEIRLRLPHASIGSDVIVGFPGEQDEDFAVNVEYLPSSPLTHLHVFPYSDRPGTEASALGDRADPAVVRERASAIRAIGTALSQRFRQSQIGTVRPGLTLEDGTLVVTDNYLKIRIPPGLARNTRTMVRVDDATSGTPVWMENATGRESCTPDSGGLTGGRPSAWPGAFPGPLLARSR
jgi:threonylcarbamoyladenosine tRNA methylthiotransferase MtaB